MTKVHKKLLCFKYFKIYRFIRGNIMSKIYNTRKYTIKTLYKINYNIVIMSKIDTEWQKLILRYSEG